MTRFSPFTATPTYPRRRMGPGPREASASPVRGHADAAVSGPVAERPRGVADHDRPVGNVLHDDGARADHRIGPDRDLGRERGPDTDEGPRADPAAAARDHARPEADVVAQEVVVADRGAAVGRARPPRLDARAHDRAGVDVGALAQRGARG